jgi:glutamyl-tRNA synthetase
VRFAPSPTGPLHIGGVRTALFNYLFAKNKGGTFILRIEDTDQTRFVEGAENYIRESLEWCGIAPSESPWQGGPFAPYRQSERKPLYMQYALQLIESGHAYYAFDTPEELDQMRKRLEAARVVSPQYNSISRMQMKNSLTLPADEVQQRLQSGEPYVIRLKVPRKEEVRLNDKVRGWVVVNSSTLDDKVLMKSDGMPTYHLANVVDDYLMEITHVIRGEEWLPSAPTHVLLYRYLGWESAMPEFAHLPLILRPDGEGKLSKRDGDKYGFSVFPLEWKTESGEVYSGFREDGFLSEALVNFLAFLGWNPGTHQEIFSLAELEQAFSMERVGKSGTKFDIEKARWYNQQYLKSYPAAELVPYLAQGLAARGIAAHNVEKLEAVVEALRDRVVFAKDFAREGAYFFEAPNHYDSEVIAKKWDAQVAEVLAAFLTQIEAMPAITASAAKESLQAAAQTLGVKVGKVQQPLRVAITGLGAGADLMQVLEILGKEEVVNRLKKALQEIEVPKVS